MTTITGTPGQWATDFMLLGAAAGALAPFFVIFDPGSALFGGATGALTGPLFGATLGLLTERLRRRVSLPVLNALAAVLGACWGAVVGAIAGAFSWWFGAEGLLYGFIVGSTSGMVALGAGFLPYVLGVTLGHRRKTVGAGLVLTPLLGWLGLAALGASTFGLWLFVLPLLLAAGLAIDRSTEAVRRKQQARLRDVPEVQVAIRPVQRERVAA